MLYIVWRWIYSESSNSHYRQDVTTDRRGCLVGLCNLAYYNPLYLHVWKYLPLGLLQCQVSSHSIAAWVFRWTFSSPSPSHLLHFRQLQQSSFCPENCPQTPSSPVTPCFQRLCSLEWAKGCYYRENKGMFRRTHYPRLNCHSSAHSDELTLKLLLSILIKSQTRPIKANFVTWHNWLWITSCVGYGSLNNSCLMADNSVHSVNKWIGDSIEFGCLQRRQVSSLHKFVSFRCFFHQPWPVKNLMHHPRCSLDMLSSLAARMGSGPVHQTKFLFGHAL